jgi:hypothetical protein
MLPAHSAGHPVNVILLFFDCAGKKIQMHGKTHKYKGMGCTYCYAGLAALPALDQGAPWPTRVSARAGSQAFCQVVNLLEKIVDPPVLM